MAFKTLCIFGTRPEAIKMAPVIKQLNALPLIQNKVCVTGQHQEMIDPILAYFDILPDFNLRVMTDSQGLSSLTAMILTKLEVLFSEFKPNLVLVHGDTTTTLAAALSAYYHRIPIAHVEAGLRTGDILSPWPEEGNRKLVGSLASLHFAPTLIAKEHLLKEGVPASSIVVTGNTVIDALFEIRHHLASEAGLKDALQCEFDYLKPSRKMILVTGHRRENFGHGFERICQALANISALYPDVDIVYPVHLNPNVQQPVISLLKGIPNIYLIAPIDYLRFVYLMKSAYFILTDSGGIQEEASSLGKPVLVMRETTERPEVVEAGMVRLVGTNVEKILAHVERLLTDDVTYNNMAQASHSYGDGHAARRIARVIAGLAVDVGVMVEDESISLP